MLRCSVDVIKHKQSSYHFVEGLTHGQVVNMTDILILQMRKLRSRKIMSLPWVTYLVSGRVGICTHGLVLKSMFFQPRRLRCTES